MKPAHAALTLLLPLGLAGDPVAFAPDEGTSLTKTFTSEFLVELDDLSVAMGGQEIDPSMMGDPEVSFALNLETIVTDEYVAVAGGRPTQLVRSYDTISGEMEVEAMAGGEGETESSSASSRLEGQKVAFKWDADEGEYTIEFADEEGDSDLLEGLEEDMDLRFLLPEGEVSEGDTWSVDADALANIIAPGGDLGMEPEEGDGDEMPEEMSDAIDDMLRELFTGEATATYLGERADGLVAIGLTVEVDSSLDVADMIGSAIADESDEVDIDMADVQVYFEGEGELLWNMDAGHLHAFELSGDATFELDVEVTQEMMGSLEASLELSGSMSFAVASE